MLDADKVKEQVKNLTAEKAREVIQKMKNGKAAGHQNHHHYFINCFQNFPYFLYLCHIAIAKKT